MKIEKLMCALILACVFITILGVGCLGDPKKENEVKESPIIVTVTPEDYFPMTGTWYYKVSLEETVPLLFHSTEKSILRTQLLTQNNFLRLKDKGPYLLVLKVQSYRETEAGTKISELKVVQDELGLLMDPTLLKWMMTKSPKNAIIAQQVYSEKGYSSRPIFHIGPDYDPGQVRIYNTDSMAKKEDVLMYEGLDNSLPGCEGQGCIKFVRKITKGSGEYGYTDNGFIEETYFAKGKGMIYLIQIVEIPGGGQKVSMVWNLEQYTAN